jgi:hypothetical protein
MNVDVVDSESFLLERLPEAVCDVCVCIYIYIGVNMCVCVCM